jgi:hypothetical protein
MAADSDELHESPSPTPVPGELVERAAALVREYPECFWFRHPEARIRHREDVRLVVEHLREYGGHRAWRAAQELNQCLLRDYKRTLRSSDAKNCLD